jgi:hypothetical protein
VFVRKLRARGRRRTQTCQVHTCTYMGALVGQTRHKCRCDARKQQEGASLRHRRVFAHCGSAFTRKQHPGAILRYSRVRKSRLFLQFDPDSRAFCARDAIDRRHGARLATTGRHSRPLLRYHRSRPHFRVLDPGLARGRGGHSREVSCLWHRIPEPCNTLLRHIRLRIGSGT